MLNHALTYDINFVPQVSRQEWFSGMMNIFQTGTGATASYQTVYTPLDGQKCSFAAARTDLQQTQWFCPLTGLLYLWCRLTESVRKSKECTWHRSGLNGTVTIGQALLTIGLATNEYQDQLKQWLMGQAMYKCRTAITIRRIEKRVRIGTLDLMVLSHISEPIIFVNLTGYHSYQWT